MFWLKDGDLLSVSGAGATTETDNLSCERSPDGATASTTGARPKTVLEKNLKQKMKKKNVFFKKVIGNVAEFIELCTSLNTNRLKKLFK